MDSVFTGLGNCLEEDTAERKSEKKLPEKQMRCTLFMSDRELGVETTDHSLAREKVWWIQTE